MMKTPRIALWLVPLLLVGCLKEVTDDSSPTTDDTQVTTDDTQPPANCTFYADGDGDGYGHPQASLDAPCDAAPNGYVDNDQDCDDADGEVNPDAVEVCDGQDNNCNGTVDDDAPEKPVFFYDGDQDGYGNPDASLQECTAPAGYVDNSEDCDDNNGSTYPGADEVCDGIDNNCDALTDGDDAIDRLSWYSDSDGDNYGRDSTEVLSCVSPGAGYTLTGEDCNDDDNIVNPGQTSFFSEAHSGGDYDYNCDDVEEQEYPDPGGCSLDTFGNCQYTAGYLITNIPACGATATYVRGCDGLCQIQTNNSRRQKCH
ncbi:MAG: putative metal-binding motif-containing protein [Alphaproteobacteria bacterium]|nr:putative metal-binding motif-containing protein [Alphaproteobacteria bacterium]